jgi:hypothetical protein
VTAGGGSRVKRFTDAIAKSDERIAALEAAAAKAKAHLTETADATPLTAARAALAAEKESRAVLAAELETAEREEAAERKAAAEREEAARQAKVRGEVERVGVEVVEALVALGKTLGRHEVLVDALPGTERFKFWPPNLAEAASKTLTAGVKKTREVSLVLRVPLGE